VAEEKEENEERDEEFESSQNQEDLSHVVKVSGMYEDWFLDYASYVILERAVPHIHDGLKPVQRRILHSLKEMDDGRYNKVANVVGNTMKYHPHGDASIADAMVSIGQKELLIDTQGNWGNIFTGDRAAASRYIEARLSKFGLEVVFNRKTTEWQASYDGRNKEPVTLPVKFPLLLAQGVEGIAVGLSCKILPHNFVELIDASIKHLQGKGFKIYPDFSTGGMIDVSNYNEGLRGGKIRCRAKVVMEDKKNLKITDVPFGLTTTSLIDSIIKANDKGKIKIKKIEDNTAEFVEINIQLAPGVSPDKTIDALYAFTNCETSISPNAVVIENDKPKFMSVHDMMRVSTERTKDLLQMELEIRKAELEEQWHFASLEKIFIEKRIYRDIEEAETWEEIIGNIHKGLKPHIKHLLREVTDEDVAKLTEIKIKRISKYDSLKADEHIAKLEEQIEEVKHHLAHLVEFAIDYFKKLKKDFGDGRERKTEIKSFETIERAKVATANVKLYADLKEGFVGHSLKRGEGEFITNCSDIDLIIVIRKDGNMIVSKIADKAFLGKDILYVNVWKKNDSRTIYNLVYQEAPGGRYYVKRFPVTGVTRDKEYSLVGNNPKGKIVYLTANPNGEAEVIRVIHRQKPKLRVLKFDFEFAELDIKGRGVKGNILTKHTIQKIELKESGVSTLEARKIWFDDSVMRLNGDGRGELLGQFSGDDKIVTFHPDGSYKLSPYALSTRFDEDFVLIEKFDPKKVFSMVYWDGAKEQFNLKRFTLEMTESRQSLLTEHEKSYMELVSSNHEPKLVLKFDKRSNDRPDEEIEVNDFISVKGMKAMGNRLTTYKVKSIDLIEAEGAAPGDESPVAAVEDEPEPAPKAEEKEKSSSQKLVEAREQNKPAKEPKPQVELPKEEAKEEPKAKKEAAKKEVKKAEPKKAETKKEEVKSEDQEAFEAGNQITLDL
jgi:topoisomerase-4 subunit A